MAKKATTLAGANPTAWLKAARHAGKGRGGWFVGHERTYRAAVEAVATILHPRFESGELVPWTPNDSRWSAVEQDRAPWDSTPNGKLSDECRRLFVTSESAAFVVLTWASRPAKRACEWHDVMGDGCALPGAALDVVAGDAMAHDVAAFARRAGWLRTTRRAA